MGGVIRKVVDNAVNAGARERAAGLAIVGKLGILLVHPTKASWKGTYSIPKGHMGSGEKELDAAIRETREEIGVRVPPKAIGSGPHKVTYPSGKTVIYWVVKASKLKLPKRIPKKSLQTAEVDWAGFVSKKEARSRMLRHQHPILKHVR